MSHRKSGHEQFRDLYKKSSLQGVAVAQSSRARSSTKSNKSAKTPSRTRGTGNGSSKSSKSIKKHSGQNKPSDKGSGRDKSAGRSKKNIKDGSARSSNRSNRRASKAPLPTPDRVATIPTTPPIKQESKTRPSNKKPSTGAPQKFNGQDVQEKTQMCNTVFENDVGMTATGGGNTGETIQLAEARIKERKLQWKKDEPRQQESSGNDDKEDEEKKKESKVEIKPPEANQTIKERTFFENDQSPAAVKEDKTKLQWAPGAAEQCMSQPAVRMKSSTNIETRGAVSERPSKDPPAKPPRGVPLVRLHISVKPGVSPDAVTPPIPSFVAPALILDVTANAGLGVSPHSSEQSKDDQTEKVTSCYVEPVLQDQQQFTSDELLKRAECVADNGKKQ